MKSQAPNSTVHCLQDIKFSFYLDIKESYQIIFQKIFERFEKQYKLLNPFHLSFNFDIQRFEIYHHQKQNDSGKSAYISLNDGLRTLSFFNFTVVEWELHLVYDQQKIIQPNLLLENPIKSKIKYIQPLTEESKSPCSDKQFSQNLNQTEITYSLDDENSESNISFRDSNFSHQLNQQGTLKRLQQPSLNCQTTQSPRTSNSLQNQQIQSQNVNKNRQIRNSNAQQLSQNPKIEYIDLTGNEEKCKVETTDERLSSQSIQSTYFNSYQDSHIENIQDRSVSDQTSEKKIPKSILKKNSQVRISSKVKVMNSHDNTSRQRGNKQSELKSIQEETSIEQSPNRSISRPRIRANSCPPSITSSPIRHQRSTKVNQTPNSRSRRRFVSKDPSKYEYKVESDIKQLKASQIFQSEQHLQNFLNDLIKLRTNQEKNILDLGHYLCTHETPKFIQVKCVDCKSFMIWFSKQPKPIKYERTIKQTHSVEQTQITKALSPIKTVPISKNSKAITKYHNKS
eukprot:403333510